MRDSRMAVLGPMLPKSLRRFGIALVLVVVALQPRPAEARGSSTPAERARIVALVRSLERDPLAESANDTRQQLRRWTVEVPDIRFKVCPDLLGHAVGDDYPYSLEINLQVVLSGAVLTIENPGEARDDVAVYVAGVEGALRAYEVLVKSRPDAPLAVLDDLIEKRDRGELVNHIARLADEHCRRSNALLIAAPIGAAVGLVLALPVAHWFRTRGAPIHGDYTPGDITERTATILRRIVLICVTYYMSVGIALHFLEPEYDPRFHFMSDYAWGAYGWLMTTNFFVLGLAILTVAVGIRDAHQSSRSAGVGVGLLVVGALFRVPGRRIQGISPPRRRQCGGHSKPRHGGAARIVELSEGSGMAGIHPVTSLIAVGMLAAIVSIVVDVGMPGLQQRAFFVLLLLWLSIVVHRLVRVANTRWVPGTAAG